MKKQMLRGIMVLFAISLMSLSCNKNDDGDPDLPGNSRKVKYELSGNYTGKILLVSSTNAGNLQQFNSITLPWSKEIEYDSGVMAAGASLQTDGINAGVPGQTITLKVYLNSKLKETKVVTADANGIFNIAMSFYTF